MTRDCLKPVAERLELLDTIELQSGSHSSFDTGHCAMEVVAWLVGADHNDHPACVCPAVASFMRGWNDGLPDDETRTRLIRPLLLETIGTSTGDEDRERRAWMGFDWLIRTFAPAWLDLVPGLEEHSVALRALPEITHETSVDALRGIGVVALAAESAARSAAESAAESAARSAARSAAWSAAESAARSAAWSAARSAAWSAARSAAESAARSAAWSAARSAAWSAARSAAESALAPTVEKLQESARDLVVRMCRVGREIEGMVA